jgi:hypothetical protein
MSSDSTTNAAPCVAIHGEHKTKIEVRPDIDEAADQFALLALLSHRFGFDLAGAVHSLAERGLPVWSCEVDWSSAPVADHRVAHYQLAERLQGALAALLAIARYSDDELAKITIASI